MATLASISPPDNAVDVLTNAPFVANIIAPSGSSETTIVETTKGDFSTGILNNCVALSPGDLALFRVADDDFSAYSTGQFPSTNWSDLGGSGTVTVENIGGNNVLQFVQPSGNRAARWDAAGTGTDMAIYGEFYASGTFNQMPGLLLRMPDANNVYGSDVNGTTARIYRLVNGAFSVLVSTTVALSANVWYAMRFEAVGSTLRMRVWPRSGTEPSAWLLTTSDSSLTYGYAGASTYTPSAATTYIDNIQVVGGNGPASLYVSSGYRESPSYDISGNVGVFGESKISWNADVPTNTTLSIAASVNGGAYTTCTNNAPIPGVIRGQTAASIKLKIDLTTSDSAQTPVLHDVTLSFFGVDADRIDIVVDGISCTVANGLLDVWNDKTIAGGAIISRRTDLWVATRCTWQKITNSDITVDVRYDGVSIGSVTTRVTEIDGAPTGLTGFYEAWSTTPDWQAGTALGYFTPINYFVEAAERIAHYFIQPGVDAEFDGFYYIGHYVVADAPACGVVGQRLIADGAAAAIVRGWSATNMTAAGIVQAWLMGDGGAAALVSITSISDFLMNGIVGKISTSNGVAAALVYGVNRRTNIEIRSITAKTSEIFSLLGIYNA